MVKCAISDLHLSKRGKNPCLLGKHLIVPLILKIVLSFPILGGGGYFMWFLLPLHITDSLILSKNKVREKSEV